MIRIKTFFDLYSTPAWSFLFGVLGFFLKIYVFKFIPYLKNREDKKYELYSSMAKDNSLTDELKILARVRLNELCSQRMFGERVIGNKRINFFVELNKKIGLTTYEMKRVLPITLIKKDKIKIRCIYQLFYIIFVCIAMFWLLYTYTPGFVNAVTIVSFLSISFFYAICHMASY